MQQVGFKVLPCIDFVCFRYADFHVNEIDSEGNEAVLKKYTMPVLPEDVKEPGKDYAAELKAIITEEKFDEIKKLIEPQSTVTSPVELDVTSFDKDQRSELHKLLQTVFATKIFNETAGDDTKKTIIVKKSKNGKQRQRSRKWPWPHEFTYFIMFKENIDTLQTISSLAYQLSIKPSHFTYAGTKDKRAMTSQWICAKKMEPQRICQAAKNALGVRVGNFKFMPNTLRLGDLKGNHFRVALRAVKGEQEEIVKSLESLRELGFLNYYGMQRFGNCPKIPTFIVGKALLLGDFKLAVELILKERDGEPPYMTSMREAWAKTQNASKALAELSETNTCVEARLLNGLYKNGENNYLQALLTIPRNMLMMYSHSYQSLLWNKIASKRRELGVEVIEGDLVYTEPTVEHEDAEVIDEASAVDDEAVTPDGEKLVTEEPVADEDPEADEEPAVEAMETESMYMAMVRPVTKEDLAAKTYTIFDIVLPLPGFDIK